MQRLEPDRGHQQQELRWHRRVAAQVGRAGSSTSNSSSSISSRGGGCGGGGGGSNSSASTSSSSRSELAGPLHFNDADMADLVFDSGALEEKVSEFSALAEKGYKQVYFSKARPAAPAAAAAATAAAAAAAAAAPATA